MSAPRARSRFSDRRPARRVSSTAWSFCFPAGAPPKWSSWGPRATPPRRSLSAPVPLAGGSFGWHRFTLARLAGVLAAPPWASGELTPVGPLPLQAICARIVHRLAYACGSRSTSRPLPIARACRVLSRRTLDELRMAGIARPTSSPIATSGGCSRLTRRARRAPTWSIEPRFCASRRASP